MAVAKNKVTLATAQQKKFARLLVEGERTITDCYCEAYEKAPPVTDADRQRLYSAAYQASNSKGVIEEIKRIQEVQAIEEARSLVWDKKRASRRLLEQCHEIEVNVAITRKLRDKLMAETSLNDVAKLNQMLKVAQICNDTARAIKECIREMNEMYGLTKPEVALTNAVQVIIGGAEDMPDDTID